MSPTLWWMLIVAAAPPLPADLLADEQSRIQMIERVTPSAIALFDAVGSTGGSGVIISEAGLALTNVHVADPIGVALRCGLPDGRLVDAVIVGRDPVGDLALIQLLPKGGYPKAPLGESRPVALGDEVVALGNPFLLSTDFKPTATLGIISGLRRYQYPSGDVLEYTDCLQTDAAVNPGNSGGPLFNRAGEVIGINGRISLEKRGRVSVGVGYAISAPQIQNFLLHLKVGWTVDHATVGARVATDDSGRVVVDDILSQSPMDQAGVRLGDEIIAFAGRPIGSVNQFKNVLGIYPSGWPVVVAWRRDDERFQAVIRLSGLRSNAGQPEAPPDRRQDSPPLKKSRPPKTKPRPIPQIVARAYEKKPGFANYRFNREARDQLLASLLKSAPQGPPRRWRIKLREGDKPVELDLSNEKLVATVAGQTIDVSPSGDPVNESGMDALALALDQWRRLEVADRSWFSRCDHAGGYPEHPVGAATESGPLPLVILPTLLLERAGIETLLSVAGQGDEVRRLYVRFSPDSTPLELTLTDYVNAGAERRPRRIRWERVGQPVKELTVFTWESAP